LGGLRADEQIAPADDVGGNRIDAHRIRLRTVLPSIRLTGPRHVGSSTRSISAVFQVAFVSATSTSS
jgi:hypothetical protein